MLHFDHYILEEGDREIDSLTQKRTEKVEKKFQMQRYADDLRGLLRDYLSLSRYLIHLPGAGLRLGSREDKWLFITAKSRFG